MRCITVHQPFASLIACGAKSVETRSWHTWHLGRLAIHAGLDRSGLILAQGDGRFRRALIAAGQDPDNLPLGAVVAVVNLQACIQMVNQSIINFLAPDEDELAFGDYRIGRYGWLFDGRLQLPEPIPAQGVQGLWEWGSPVDVSFERSER